MNIGLKFGLLTVAAGIAMQTGDASAAVAQHFTHSNALNYCQAFTPGPSNTIRNRVIGSENIGATLAVACNFAAMNNGAAGAGNPKRVSMYFSNNSGADILVTCSMLTGYQGQSGTYLVTKSTTAIPGGGGSQRNLAWAAADNPVQPATTLGNDLIGVNCILPTGAVINDIYFYWDMDNGV